MADCHNFVLELRQSVIFNLLNNMKLQILSTIFLLTPLLSFSQNPQKVNLVDLDLPSGILWMDRNLGANNSYDFGEYYLGTDTPALPSLGEGFAIPSKDQFQELMDHTVQKWTVLEGVEGMAFTTANGKSIFLPAAAQLYWDYEGHWAVNNDGTGAYWTCTPSNYSDYIYFVEFNEEKAFFGDREKNDNRIPIRPIFDKNAAGVTMTPAQPEEVRIITTPNSIILTPSESGLLKYTLLRLSGETIMTGETRKETTLDNLGKGIYLLKIATSSFSKSLKIIL